MRTPTVIPTDYALNNYGTDWIELVGFIPSFLDLNDSASARDQLDKNYRHGGGWQPMSGWKLYKGVQLKYPGDPPLKPVACIKFRKELVYIYNYAWVAIIQSNGTFEVARMD